MKLVIGNQNKDHKPCDKKWLKEDLWLNKILLGQIINQISQRLLQDNCNLKCNKIALELQLAKTKEDPLVQAKKLIDQTYSCILDEEVKN